MNVKSYRGKTADECMKKLKSDLGSDAVILQSRTVKPILGRFGRPMHEIVAADDTGAVLDKFAEKAGDRRTAADTSRATAAPAEAQPRLTLSRGIIGNTALAAQAQPPAGASRAADPGGGGPTSRAGRVRPAGRRRSAATARAAATSSATSSTRSMPAQERGDASSQGYAACLLEHSRAEHCRSSWYRLQSPISRKATTESAGWRSRSRC